MKLYILALAATFAAAAPGPLGWKSPPLKSPLHQKCNINGDASCSIGKASCCLEATNGLIVSTQFWDYAPAIGPGNKFTLHGLWADKCKGGYSTHCNPDWGVTDPRSILEKKAPKLLNKMSKIWKNYKGKDKKLWKNEFNKHGTCFQTLAPACYNGDSKDQNVVDYYSTAVHLWESLPTYEWLKKAGLRPSKTKRNKVADFQKALASNLGVQSVHLGCDKKGNLNQIYYFFNVKGSIANGNFIPTDADDKGNCKDGFKWLPKNST